MTWAEFKAAVEKAGMQDDDELWYIDVNPAPSPGWVFVGRDDPCGAYIIDDCRSRAPLPRRRRLDGTRNDRGEWEPFLPLNLQSEGKCD